MSIKFVVLGFLSWQAASGYDLKKIISDSETLPWSGNSNQIYRALVDLHDEGLVTQEIEHQEKLPARKIYSITAKGRDKLSEWSKETPLAPQFRKPFLAQLLWADQLSPREIDQLLDEYLNTVGEKLFMVRVQADRKPNTPDRTPRETFLWEMVQRNWIASYELELSWIREMREALHQFDREFSKREASN
ncbi:MAG: PadR family transcriptional regulator [Chloroflexota bacterium]